jgi:hypothetical protein
VDVNSGNTWLYGGGSYGGDRADVFMYSQSNNQCQTSISHASWLLPCPADCSCLFSFVAGTWMAGQSSVPTPAVYTQGMYNPILDNSGGPGSRVNPTCWFWNAQFVIFGGATIVTTYQAHSDTWIYNTVGDSFTWVSGSKDTGSAAASQSFYGPLGVSNASCNPFPRSQAAGVADLQGRLW